jgi:hypothetical protein
MTSPYDYAAWLFTLVVFFGSLYLLRCVCVVVVAIIRLWIKEDSNGQRR